MTATDALKKKMAIEDGSRVIVRHCPPELHGTFTGLGAVFDRGTIAEVTISFVTSRADVAQACKEGIALTIPDGVLWMVYPKKTGTIPSDISRDEGWEPFAAAGWRPVSQIALDETWSALRFRPIG